MNTPDHLILPAAAGANENSSASGCNCCGAERICKRGRSRKLCTMCFRIFAEKRRLSTHFEQLLKNGAKATSWEEEAVRIKYDLEYYTALERSCQSLGLRHRHQLERPEGDSIEGLLKQVGEMTGCPETLFHGLTNTFNHNFAPEQRSILCDLLLDIVRYGGAKRRRFEARQAAADITSRWASARRKAQASRSIRGGA